MPIFLLRNHRFTCPFFCTSDQFLIGLQSLIASQMLSVIDLMLAATIDNVFDVLQGIFFVITGGLTMAFATLKNSQGLAVMQGMLVGNLVATPLLAVIGNSLYSGVAGCTGVGDPTKDFPQGQPSDCTSDQLFLSMFYVMKAITWIVTLFCGMLGTHANIAPLIGMFSSAMTGAELFWKSFLGLIYTFTDLANPRAADNMVKQIAFAEMFLTYIAAAFGIASMVSLKAHLAKMQDEKANMAMCEEAANEEERAARRSPPPNSEKEKASQGEAEREFSPGDLKNSSGLIGFIARSPVIYILKVMLYLENGITNKMKSMDMAERLKNFDEKCKNMTEEQRMRCVSEMSKEERDAYEKRAQEKKGKGNVNEADSKRGVVGTLVSSCWSSVGFAPKDEGISLARLGQMDEDMNQAGPGGGSALTAAKTSDVVLNVPGFDGAAGQAPVTPNTDLKKVAAARVHDWPATPVSALSAAETPAAAALCDGADGGPSINRRGAALSGATLQPRRLGGFEEVATAGSGAAAAADLAVAGPY